MGRVGKSAAWATALASSWLAKVTADAIVNTVFMTARRRDSLTTRWPPGDIDPCSYGHLIALQACPANAIMHCSRGVDHNLELAAKAAYAPKLETPSSQSTTRGTYPNR